MERWVYDKGFKFQSDGQLMEAVWTETHFQPQFSAYTVGMKGTFLNENWLNVML